jgi:RNA polymerase-binding transcription factor DksA
MAKKKKKGTIFEGRIEKEEEGLTVEQDGFLEPEEHAGSHEEEGAKLHAGEKGTDVYTEEGREELEETGEMQPWEEGFAKGATGKGEYGVCEHCGKPLGDREEEVIEREIKGELKYFCSEKCANKCKAEHKKG